MCSIIEPGYECEFAEELPKFVRSTCPICLLILRDPHQVTCCGKSFCRSCILRVRESSEHCPACKQEGFSLYPDKGLKQELCGHRVFCSNKGAGCEWEGELGEVAGHLNANPDVDEQFEGCGFTSVSCLYCTEVRPRNEIRVHQEMDCFWRPFTCFMCEEYESTYEDVVNSHAPVCKCRPVECPNSCGADNLQHQHLEEHVSSQCPLTYVECEFSDAGCDAKVYRKNLASHLTDNLVTHMSLLAVENRKLKQQLKQHVEKVTEVAKIKRAKEKKRRRSLLQKQANFMETVRSELKREAKSSVTKSSMAKKSGQKTSKKRTAKIRVH